MTQHMTTRELPVSERPYEKCLLAGPQALSDAELLAVILKSGSREMNVLRVQKEVTDVMDIMPDIVDEAVNGENFNQRIIKECREAIRSLLQLVHFGQSKTACENRKPL